MRTKARMIEQFADEAILAGNLPSIWMPYWSDPDKRDTERMEKGRQGLRVRDFPYVEKLLSEAPAGGYLLGGFSMADVPMMVLAMVLAGLRRCEVLGLRMADVRVGDRSLFVAEGKGGHQRVVPVAGRFLRALGDYLHDERPAAAPTDRVFVVLKGPRRGLPLSAEGLDEILAGARRRAGLEHATCHQLRHTCLTRLREAGMALEAVQAQAGHRSIESTRIYLHLTNDWLADQYQRAAVLIDADQKDVTAMIAAQEVAGK